MIIRDMENSLEAVLKEAEMKGKDMILTRWDCGDGTNLGSWFIRNTEYGRLVLRRIQVVLYIILCSSSTHIYSYSFIPSILSSTASCVQSHSARAHAREYATRHRLTLTPTLTLKHTRTQDARLVWQLYFDGARVQEQGAMWVLEAGDRDFYVNHLFKAKPREINARDKNIRCSDDPKALIQLPSI